MALTCSAGYYFDERLEECRNCEYVCGEQYGGHEQLECRDNCPGYGVSTTSAPATYDDKVMWIVMGSCAAFAIIVIFVIVMICFKKKRCFWKTPPKPIVQEESKEGLVAVSAPAYA